MNPSSERSSEAKSALVSGCASDKQAEEDLWSHYKAERYGYVQRVNRSCVKVFVGIPDEATSTVCQRS